MPGPRPPAGAHSRSLLLVAHGSGVCPEASAPVRAHAARIRRRALFDEVHTAFWKEDPPIREALGRIAADEVFVVPVLFADGYFARRVVPRELALGRGANRRGSRTVHYCPPVGTHPHMDRLVLRRAREVAPLAAAERRRAALVVVGHGTERDPDSGGLVHALVRRLRKRGGGYGLVEAAFLDEEPRVRGVVARMGARDVVLVPFFAGEGPHTRETIPDALQLAGRRTVRDGRVLWYAKPVGTCPEVAHLVVEVALRGGATRTDVPPGGAAAAQLLA